MEGVAIVPLNESLCDRVAALEAACFGADAWPPQAFHTLRRTYGESPDFRGHVWVAVDERRQDVAGYVALEVTSLGEAELTNLAVAPAYRRQGIGRLLVSFVVSVCQEVGVELLWLRVRRRASTRRADLSGAVSSVATTMIPARTRSSWRSRCRRRTKRGRSRRARGPRRRPRPS